MRAVVVQSQPELDECLAIRWEVFTLEQQVPEDLEVDDGDQLEAAMTHVLLYDDEHQPVATARMKMYQPGSAKVQRVAVRPALRGRGYGAAIMQVLEDLALSQDYRAIVLDAQLHAKGFYEKIGYETVSEIFLEAGIEHVRMQKRLNPEH